MIVPAHEATRLICAKSQEPNLGSIVPSQVNTDSEILTAQAFSRVLRASGETLFVVASVESVVSTGTFVSAVMTLVVAARAGKKRSRQASTNGRRETHLARSSWRSRE